MKYLKEELKDKLKKLRVNNHLTQDFVASKLNIVRSTYSYYEKGTTMPNLDNIKKLAKIFNVTEEYLLGFDDTRELNDSINNISRMKPIEKTPESMSALTKEERQLIANYRLIPVRERRRYFSKIEELSNIINNKPL